METRISKTRRLVIEERGYVCGMCGSERDLQLHHHLFHKQKKYPELDCKENCQLLCDSCHDNLANSYESRRVFWKTQCERYGEAYMLAWWTALPLKIKQRFW